MFSRINGSKFLQPDSTEAFPELWKLLRQQINVHWFGMTYQIWQLLCFSVQILLIMQRKNEMLFTHYIIIIKFTTISVPCFCLIHESHLFSPSTACEYEAVSQSVHVRLIRSSRLFDENIQLNVWSIGAGSVPCRCRQNTEEQEKEGVSVKSLTVNVSSYVFLSV